jgi:hypothetical protein
MAGILALDLYMLFAAPLRDPPLARVQTLPSGYLCCDTDMMRIHITIRGAF